MSNIVVPELGESVVEARVARWLKKEGDRVEIGEALVELETDKVDLEVNAEKGGVLSSITRHEGDDVKIGELLGVVDESAAAAAAPSGNGSKGTAPAAAAPVDQRATPTAKRMARDHEVDLGAVQGSGASGRVMKQDVQNVIAKPAAPPPASKAKEAPAPAPRAPAPRAPGERTERRER